MADRKKRRATGSINDGESHELASYKIFIVALF